jgi:DNA-binding CsgD family transcriptional regulator
LSAGAFEAWNPAFERYLHGRLAMASGQTATALQEFATAAAAFAAINDREYFAAARCQQAAAYVDLGDLNQARQAYRDGLTLAIEIAQPYWMAWGLAGASYFALQASQRSQASRLYAAALRLLEETGLAWPDDAACKALSMEFVPSATASTLGTSQEARARALREAMSVLANDASEGGKPAGPLMDLTSREREVLAQLAQGLTDKEIAVALQISRNTAVNHVAAIRRKLGVPSRAAAVAVAARLGAPDSA